MEQTKKKQLILSVIGVIVLLLIVGGISYAMYTFIGTGSKENVITSGKISIDYKEKTTINLNGAYPTTDERGIREDNNSGVVEFDVISDIVGNKTINYAIGITDIKTGTTLKEDNIKIYMYKNGIRVNGFEEQIGKKISEFEPYYIAGVMDKYVLITDTISGKTTNTYKIKAWVDENYKLPTSDTSSGTTHENTTTSETFTFKVKVVATDSALAINKDLENPVITDVKMYLVNEVAYLNNINNIQLLANTNKEELTNQILTKDNKIEIELIYSENIYGTAPTIELKFGNNTSVGTVSEGIISENKITYNYTVQEQDNGSIQLGSITSGGIKDNNGNQALSTISSTIQDKLGNIETDNTKPVISSFTHLGSGVIKVVVTDTNLDSVCINTSATDVTSCSWEKTTGTYQKTVTTATNYYAHAKDKAGNITHSSALSVVLNLDTSGAKEPDLVTGMIPVYYDSANDVWRKADKNNSNSSYQWFSYESSGSKKGMWANAVTVTETNRTTYLNAALGTAISMDDINTMFVWIPRFNAVTPSNYNGGTRTAPGAINVTFVDTNTTALDAFWWDENNNGTQDTGEQKSGFWFGKFETSHSTLASSTTSNNLGCTNETCSNANGIIIKPNVKSLRYNNVSNFFYAGRSMEQTNNPYGFVSSEVDTHMLKNNEWGAVAYLTQSIYGRCTSSTSCTEVTINDNSSYITGDNAYKKNTNQSTTGTIYGIYDMSGGAYEYVMGNYNNTRTSYDGFSSIPASKYYNLYTGTSYTGHALTETAGWYIDSASFVISSDPWFLRGGYYYGGAGVFSFDFRNGNADGDFSSRLSIVK